jgi:hypothetical protein
MRRFFTLVCLLCLAIPAGISISGCTRNPAENYCNGLGYGTKITDVASIDLEPRTTGISLAFGQTQQVSSPTAKTCQGTTAAAGSYSYGTTNNQLVDISPTGNICAGTWNRNSGGGIADYTICNKPNPVPTTGGLPYGSAYITAAANAVTSNPVQVFVHAQVTSISLVGPSGCQSQGTISQLDSQACYSTTVNGQPATALLCAPSSITSPSQYACPLPAGVSSVPNCNASIGTLAYTVSINSVASINSETNQITAGLPGTTAITASIAGSGSSAGYFSTCPPQSISITLNGKSGTASPVTVSQGVPQNMVTTVTDTNGNTITGLTLDYQSTNAVDISAGSTGTISALFPGEASIFAICQPSTCNPSPINEVGLFGTGLPVSSNPVAINTLGTASAYVWFAAPGQSQYFIPIDLLSGTVGSTVRLPYVPNSMVMDQLGNNLYFGSVRELMIYSTATNSLTKQDTNVPGVVLAVSPNNQTLLINDQARQVFYIYGATGSIQAEFNGLGNAAAWTPDSKTLYITDNASLNNPPAITGHTDTLYVYNVNTGWTTYPTMPLASSPLPPGALPPSTAAPNTTVAITSQTPALTIPGVGAYVRGNPTNAYTWCPSGIVGDYASMVFYPQGDSVPVQTDALAATTDGQHILGAALTGGGVTLSDIGVTIPNSPVSQCPITTTGTGANQVQKLSPLNLTHAQPFQFPLNRVVNATAVNQVVASPVSNLAFITYTGGATSGGPSLPYYVPGTGGAPGTVNYVPLTGSSVTAPLAGTFSPDDTTFFVSTAGDNLIHYIDVKTLKDTQQIAPNLPACTPGSDPGCLLPPSTTSPVPATVITVKPRTTT